MNSSEIKSGINQNAIITTPTPILKTLSDYYDFCSKNHDRISYERPSDEDGWSFVEFSRLKYARLNATSILFHIVLNVIMLVRLLFGSRLPQRLGACGLKIVSWSV